MVWVRLADDFTDHPKVVAAGPLAGWLYVCGLTYSNRYLTDGFVPSGQVRRMADVDDALGLADRLVEVGLWEVVEGGYLIHDYHGYQPSAEDVKREREETARRQAEYRARKRNGASNGVTNDERSGAPARPVPGPVNPVPAPAPAGNPSPQPPPVEGEPPPAPRKRGERPRRGERANGASSHDQKATAAEHVELTPVSSEDLTVWNQALADASAGVTPGNAEVLGELVPVGRAPDGGLHLRAPPGRTSMGRFRNLVARALLDAGDQAATRVVIFEGRPGSREG